MPFWVEKGKIIAKWIPWQGLFRTEDNLNLLCAEKCHMFSKRAFPVLNITILGNGI